MKTRPVEPRVGNELTARPAARGGDGEPGGFAGVLAEQGRAAPERGDRVGVVARERRDDAKDRSTGWEPTAAPAPRREDPQTPASSTQPEEAPERPTEKDDTHDRAGASVDDAAARAPSAPDALAVTGYVTPVGVLVVPHVVALAARPVEVVGATAWEARVGAWTPSPAPPVELPERVSLSVTTWTEGTARRLHGEPGAPSGVSGGGGGNPLRNASPASSTDTASWGTTPLGGRPDMLEASGVAAPVVAPDALVSGRTDATATLPTARRGRRSTLPTAPPEVLAEASGPRNADTLRGATTELGQGQAPTDGPPVEPPRHPGAGSPAVPSAWAPADASGGGVAEGGGPPSAPSFASSSETARDSLGDSLPSTIAGPLGAGSVPLGMGRAADGAAPLEAARAPVDLLEAPGLLPDHLVLDVRDDAGRWRMDLQRHALGSDHHGLDVLLLGDARLVQDLRGADTDLRAALARDGTTLLSLDVQADARGGGQSGAPPPAPGLRGLRGRGAARAREAALRDGTSAPRAAAEPMQPPGRLDRLA